MEKNNRDDAKKTKIMTEIEVLKKDFTKIIFKKELSYKVRKVK